MTARLHDWQLRLQDCLAERWARPFQWGVQDCCMFAADCVLAITGVDTAQGFRGTYSTAVSAATIVGRAGGLSALAAAALGEEISPLMAQAGDVGLADADGQPGLAIWGGTAWLAAGLDGVVVVPSPTRAWRCC